MVAREADQDRRARGTWWLEQYGMVVYYRRKGGRPSRDEVLKAACERLRGLGIEAVAQASHPESGADAGRMAAVAFAADSWAQEEMVRKAMAEARQQLLHERRRR
jgi:hypothetical protein